MSGSRSGRLTAGKRIGPRNSEPAAPWPAGFLLDVLAACGRTATLIPATALGEMAEWFKAPVLKTGEGASPPWVRIPLSPPPYAPAGFGWQATA